jgi:hypothetical protein
VIAYNSILLSGILNRYQAVGNQKALELLMRISPVAWQHIHFLLRDSEKAVARGELRPLYGTQLKTIPKPPYLTSLFHCSPDPFSMRWVKRAKTQ